MRPLLPALAALLALPACGAAPEEPTATPSASEATPTAAPTPATFDDWYALTSLAIAPESQGLDYDGDGTKDNGIYAALDAAGDGIQDAVHELLYANVDYPAPGDPCEETGTCGIPPKADEIEALVKNLVETYLTPEAINAALDAVFDNGARPYALHLYGTCPEVTLAYHQGELTAAGYVPGELLGALDAPICGGTSALGPQTFTYDVTLDPPQGEPVTLGLTVYEVLTSLNLGDPDRISAYTGGGLKIVEIASFLATLITDEIPDGPVPPSEVYDQILAALEQSLLAVSDITCDSGDACVSITFTYAADATTLAP